VLLVVAGGYFTIDFAGGSGYLGAFIAGLIAGNMDELGLGMHSGREAEMRSFAATVSDVVVMFVFLVLGANLPFGDMADEALPALSTIAALILIAEGVPYETELVTVVAFAILVTLAVQSTTKPWLARRLRLDDPRA
jgi:NhaP-type Na+/H+ or K+/H+ antiporter